MHGIDQARVVLVKACENNKVDTMIKTFAMCCSVILSATWAAACCMVPVTYKGSIGQKAQEAVLIHDGTREELVLRINYQITGGSMPTNFAWVITTPKEPDAYALADAQLFEDMFKLSQQRLVPRPRTKSLDQKADSIPEGIELGKRVEVGPYDIQPIRGVGPNALTGLNTWLKNNAFPTEAPDHMTYFVKHNFTFLCVRVIPPDEQAAVKANGLLPPLHLSFETPVPYYPLRFSSRQGVFDVNLHVLTRGKLDYKRSGATLARLNWNSKHYKRNVRIAHKEMPDTLRKVFGNSTWKDQPGTWRYNNLRCNQVNKGNTISTWWI